MDSKTPRVLVIGESSLLSYLTYVLTRSDWHVTTLSYNAKKTVNRSQTWIMFTEDNSYGFAPHSMLANMTELKSWLAANAQYHFQFDVIVLETKGQRMIEETANVIKDAIHERTLFMVDSSDNLWFLPKVENIFSNNVVLAMYSDVDCRMLGVDTNCFQIMGDYHNLSIGYNGTLVKRETEMSLQLLGYQGMSLFALKSAYEKYSNGKNARFLPLEKRFHLSRQIWFRLLSLMSFEALSVIFEEPHIVTLAKEINVVPIMKGIFNELLQLGRSTQIENIPKEYSVDAKRLLKDLIMKENKKSNTRKMLTSKKCYLPKFIDSNKTFYDFSQGHNLSVINILFDILTLADQHHIKVPFIESIYSFTDRLLAIRDGIDFRGKVCPSKLFQVKNNRNSMSKLISINGIPPEKNMMNFPPFNPLPLPRPPTHVFIEEPLVFMSGVNQNSTKNQTDDSDEDNVSIDSQLQGLMVGREDLTYGDEVFFDATEDGIKQSQESTDSHQQTTTTETSTSNIHSHRKETDAPFFIPATQIQNSFPMHATSPGFPTGAPNFQPSQVTTLTDAQGNHYMVQPNGSIVLLSSVNKNASLQYSRIAPKKKQTFYHVPISIGKHTPSHKLRESHHNLLELVQFNGLMDQGISSRYGDLDTSSTALNSANNSGRSSGRSSLAPSRDSIRFDSPRPSVQKTNNPESQSEANKNASEEPNDAQAP